MFSLWPELPPVYVSATEIKAVFESAFVCGIRTITHGCCVIAVMRGHLLSARHLEWPKHTVLRNHFLSLQFSLSSIAFDLHLGLVLFPVFESLTINITLTKVRSYLLPGVLKCAFIYIFSQCWCSYDVQLSHAGLTGFNKPGILDWSCYVTFYVFREFRLLFLVVWLSLSKVTVSLMFVL